jgi:hypothetical protein
VLLAFLLFRTCCCCRPCCYWLAYYCWRPFCC